MPPSSPLPQPHMGPETSPLTEGRTLDQRMAKVGPYRSPDAPERNDSRKDHDPADYPEIDNIDRAQEQTFLTGSRLHLVSTAFGIANIMVALDSSILGRWKHASPHPSPRPRA